MISPYMEFQKRNAQTRESALSFSCSHWLGYMIQMLTFSRVISKELYSISGIFILEVA